MFLTLIVVLQMLKWCKHIHAILDFLYSLSTFIWWYKVQSESVYLSYFDPYLQLIKLNLSTHLIFYAKLFAVLFLGNKTWWIKGVHELYSLRYLCSPYGQLPKALRSSFSLWGNEKGLSDFFLKLAKGGCLPPRQRERLCKRFGDEP